MRKRASPDLCGVVSRTRSSERDAVSEMKEDPSEPAALRRINHATRRRAIRFRWCGRGGAARLPPIPITRNCKDLSSSNRIFHLDTNLQHMPCPLPVGLLETICFGTAGKSILGRVRVGQDYDCKPILGD